MNATEAGLILARLSAVDRREVDKTTAQGWAWALADVTYERGLEAAERAVRSGAGYVDITAIRRELKAMQPRFETDVRSAKARGLVPADWPNRKPLPVEIERRLREAQGLEYGHTNDVDLDAITAAQTQRELGR